MMEKRLERFGEVEIVDETNGFGMNFWSYQQGFLGLRPGSDINCLRIPYAELAKYYHYNVPFPF